MKHPVHQLSTTYVCFEDGGAAATIPTEGFWDKLTTGALPQVENGRLITQGVFNGEWDHWEMHPHGEELVMLVSGAVTLFLEDEEGVTEARLEKPGDYVLIQRGTWHRAACDAQSTLFFVTAGKGTEHRPR